MDYREKHSKPPEWHADVFYPQCRVNAYGVGDVSGLFEVHAPDNSTCFLGTHGFFDEPAGLVYCYGIDSPRNCPERQAFEWGKMSWMDFWSHKSWLLRMVIPFDPGHVITSYIQPSELPEIMINAFNRYACRGPYIMKRDQLKLALEHSSFTGDDPIEAERRYLEFMAQHGHRFRNPAA